MCLADHTRLVNELARRCDSVGQIDHLADYRAWFDRKGVDTEGPYGWATDAAFDDKNIAAYAEAEGGKT